MQRSQQFLVEAGADVADPAQRTIVIDAQNERAEVVAASLGRGETADGEFLFADDFDFEPLAAAAGFVGAGSVLGDDAL